jgi:hypothetical protein
MATATPQVNRFGVVNDALDNPRSATNVKLAIESDMHWRRTQLSFGWTLILRSVAAATLASFL